MIKYSTRNPCRYYNKIAWGKFGTYWVFYIALGAFLFSDLARDLEVSLSVCLSVARARAHYLSLSLSFSLFLSLSLSSLSVSLACPLM